MALRTDYKNDELNTAVNTERQYEEVTNPNGTKSYRDVTDYSQVGDDFDADLVNSQNAEINAKAPIDSPTFTGTPTAPTQSQSTVDDTIATTSYVKSAFGNIIDPNLRTSGKAADAQVTGNRIASVQASVPMVDSTLSIIGAAADAKAVGDAIENIPTVDTTLSISGRAADSKTVGDALGELETDLNQIKDADSYNLLDVENIILYPNRSLSTNLYRYNTSPNVVSFAFPVEGGKTYTFSRKNTCARLWLGCGENLYTDTENHALLNTVDCTGHTSYGTITVPTSGRFLYVFFCNLNYDSSTTYALEEAMITEGSEVLPYEPYSASISIKREQLSLQVRNELDEGTQAYTDVGSIKPTVDAIQVKGTYNILDVDNLTVYDHRSLDVNLYRYNTSSGTYCFAIPVEEGKTYTFSRKNATARLWLGCGEDIYTDNQNHSLLNTVNATSHSSYATITVPTGGKWLYVFFCNMNYDSSLDYTLEEAMITEWAEVLPYVEYEKILDVQMENLSTEIIAELNKSASGLVAYNDIVSIQDMVVDDGGSYNLLDIETVTILSNYYVDTSNTGTLMHSSGDVRTIAFPVEEGKTYTFTRKNATSRLIAGCGSQFWNDSSNHTLLNVVDARSVGDHFTITVPTNGTYLYIFFYRAASDSSYDATIEEAMIVEGSEILPYVPYIEPGHDPSTAAEDIANAINLGKTAYSLVSADDDRWNSRRKIYGIQFNVNNTDPVCERIADASNLSQEDFDNIFPWCEMRRCAVTIANENKSIIYDGETGFALDGSAGNVMVEIPAFYVLRERINGVERWLISGTQYGGFELHPWFKNADGSVEEYRYYGAYIACNESGIFSATGKQAYNNSGISLVTFANTARSYGYERNNVFAFSAIQYLFAIEYATRNSQSVFNGNTYSPYHNTASTGAWEVIESIENNVIKCGNGYNYSGNSFLFYKVGMQVFIGTGEGLSNGIVRTITAITHDSSNFYITVDGNPITLTEGMRISSYAQKSGLSDGVTTPSGKSSQDSHVASFRYRWIENPWGNLWEVLDGLRLKNGVYYITHDFAETDLTKWDKLSYAGLMISATDHDANNWIKSMGYDHNFRSVMIPNELFTDNGRTVTLKTDSGEVVSTSIVLRGEKHYCDAFYSGTSTTAEYVPVVGGGWDHHENGGLFCLRFITSGNWLYGERITL